MPGGGQGERKSSGGNGSTLGSSFEDALMHLGKLHAQEVEVLRQDFEAELQALRQENQALRGSLSKAGISPDDIVLDSVEPRRSAAPPSAASPLAGAAARTSPLADAAARTSEAGVGTKRSPSEQRSTSSPAGGNGVKVLALKDVEDDRTQARAFRDTLREQMLVEGEFKMKDAWNKVIDCSQWGSNLDAFMSRYGTHKTMRTAVLATVATSEIDDALADEAVVEDTGCTIYPNSTWRMSWDFVGLILISYDLITIPVNLAFMPDPTLLSNFMDWVTLLFWTADMLQGFFLGYFEKGMYISNNRKILKHYLLTWFLPDVIVVGPEWLVLLASASLMGGDSSSVSEVGKIMKGARAVRALRLLRLLKLQRIINVLYDMIESEHTFIVVNLAKLLVAVLVLNHVIACLWYLIGRICMDNGLINWIEVAKIQDDSSQYKYLSALHWSLTQFTPASMDISARNIWERLFSIVVLFFAMVAFSSIVASITGSMTSLRNMKTEDMKQFWLLRRYLRQRSVKAELCDRIFKYLEHETQKQSKLVERKRIAVLGHLSQALQSELTHALNSPSLIGHPFFRDLDSNMSVVMHRLCHTCLKNQSHAEREVIFSAGEKASLMYFIKPNSTTNGSPNLEYTSVDGDKLNPPPGKFEWVSEGVLWTEWRHQGELLSVSTNDLIGVDPNTFLDVMCVHPRPWFYAKRYAAKYLKFLNCLESHRILDILRDEVFYETAVRDCDQSNQVDQEGFDSLEPSECDEPGDQREADEPALGSGRSPLSRWTRGIGGGTGSASPRAVKPSTGRRGFFPCGGTMPCDPWCGQSAGRR